MSTSALMMTESSVIKHYKKQLIHRQHDLPDQEHQIIKNDHIDQNGIYDFVETDTKNDDKVNNVNNGKKTRKKRKNRNCRGQFRHEGMELIKLGTNTTHSLCKTKEPYNVRMEKPFENPPNKEDLQNPEIPKDPTNKKSVIQSTFNEKTIILENQPTPYGHSLPQMVPERRNSREMNLPKPPEMERRKSTTDLPPTKIPTVTYNTPSRLPPPSDYRVPIHPTPTHSLPYLSPPSFTPPHMPYRHHLPPPPPYTASHSPPLRPHPRSAFQPASVVPPPYPGMHFPYPRHHHYSNGYLNPPPPPCQNPPAPRHEYEECRKRMLPPVEGDVHRPIKKPTPPVVAAIDLTVDQSQEKRETTSKHHKCQCECGKTYTSDPMTQDVIITVASDKDYTQVPTINLRGKLVNGFLRLESQKQMQGKEKPMNVQQNGTVEKKEVIKTCCPSSKAVSDKQPSEGKLPQLFLIKDLLAKGVRVEKKSSHRRIEEEVVKTSQPTVISPKHEEKPPSRPQGEPHRVIVSANDYHHHPKEPPVRTKAQDYTVNNIIGKNRRPSVDIDTISISSSSSESLRSPRPKPDGIDKQIPQGKLFYYKTNNSFIRYFEDAQKKLFFDNLIADGKGCELRHGEESREIIELPKNTSFSNKDSLTVEEYVNEMTLAEKFIPKDFFFFYKFVTGYQICHNHLPVSFLTFLKVYNTNGLKDLLERYISSLKQAS